MRGSREISLAPSLHRASTDALIAIVEPLNPVRDECFVHCSEVVPSLKVEMYGQYIGWGSGGVHYRRLHCTRESLSVGPGSSMTGNRLWTTSRLVNTRTYTFRE